MAVWMLLVSGADLAGSASTDASSKPFTGFCVAWTLAQTRLSSGNEGSLIVPHEVCTLSGEAVVAANVVANIIVPNVAHMARTNNFCEKDFAFMQCSVDKTVD
jgi:hypothetical protein